MIFLPTGKKKYPAAFVVFDKVATKTGGYKKAFLLHGEEKMEVDGHVSGVSYYGPAKTAEEAQVLAEHFQR